MKNTLLSVACAFSLLSLPTTASAQDSVETELGANDAVTSPSAPSIQDTDTPSAQDTDTLSMQDAGELTLDAFKWQNRVLIVFAESPLDPNFSEQIALLETRPDLLSERDVIVITDTDPAATSELRKKLRPRGFALVIVDKDGRVMLRKPRPWDLREITRAIDKTSLRQQELREAKEAARALVE